MQWIRRRSAEPLCLLLFDQPEQLRLRVRGQLGDAVEIHGPFSGGLESPRPGDGRVGEGAALVAEQLRFDEGLRQRGTIDLDERLLASGAGAVDGERERVLSGAGLAGQEDAGVGPRETFDLREDVTHGGAAGDEPRDSHVRPLPAAPARGSSGTSIRSASPQRRSSE